MKKIVLLFGLMLFLCQSNAQDLEPIHFIDGAFYQGDIALSRKAVKEAVRGFPIAYQEVKSGKSRMTAGYIVGLTGAVVVGGGIGSAIAGKEHEGQEGYLDPLTGILVGGACLVGGLLLSKSGATKFVKGVEIYNSSIDSGKKPNDVLVNFGLSDHGIGLTVRF